MLFINKLFNSIACLLSFTNLQLVIPGRTWILLYLGRTVYKRLWACLAQGKVMCVSHSVHNGVWCHFLFGSISPSGGYCPKGGMVQGCIVCGGFGTLPPILTSRGSYCTGRYASTGMHSCSLKNKYNSIM